MEIPILHTLGILLGLAVIVLLVFRKFNVHTIIGFLITGMLAGPTGLELVSASHEIDSMAELGVILLLFIIGMEFSLKTLSQIKKAILIGGLFQVGMTIALPAALFYMFGFSWPESLFIGFLLSLSSSAIILKILSDKGEINSPHGKTALAILIFQDIIVIPMILLTPIIAGTTNQILPTLAYLTLKTILLVFIVIISARYLVPKLLYIVAKTKNKELFILTIASLCILTMLLTSGIGLSLALGAFMAGLIISESEYSHQAISNILPFREIFSSIFFISIGMLLDLNFLIDHIIAILGLTLLVIIVKSIIATGAGFALKYPARTSLLAGLMLFQVGEFAFVLSKTGMEYNILNPVVYQYFLAVSIITMALTPLIISKSEYLVAEILHLPLPKPIKAIKDLIESPIESDHFNQKLEDHLIIIGFGINGQNIAKAAKSSKIPYVIVELNPDTVKLFQEKGEPILFGDAVHSHILQHCQVSKSRVIVIAISDPEATKKIIVEARTLAPTAYILVRSRFVKNIETYLLLGANEVIPEEFETSIQIFARVLNKYFIPIHTIQQYIDRIRADNYDFLRLEKPIFSTKYTSDLSSLHVAAINLEDSSGKIAGKTLAQAELRQNFGINIVAIQINGSVNYDITPDTILENGQIIYISGPAEKVRSFAEKSCALLKKY